jgi:TatD DNase family protein
VIDTHCHLTHARLAPDTDDVVASARAAGLTACITIGTGVVDAERALALTLDEKGFVFCAAGIDPFSAHRAGDGFEGELRQLEDLLREGGFCALGEIGLDYHYDLDPRPVQATRFEAQLDLSAALDLPVVIHVREAHADMLDILARHRDCRGVIHSFTAGPAEAERYLELGWYLAFNGVLTYRNAEDVRSAARIATDDRLLVETDSPYLAPVPLRGKRCEPSMIVHTAERLAEIRAVPVEEIRASTTANARRLFGLDAISSDRSS